MSKQKKIFFLYLILFLLSAASICFSQDFSNCYKIKGYIDFLSKKCRKTDAKFKLDVVVYSKYNKKTRSYPSIHLSSGASLRFGPQNIPRLPEDSSVQIEITIDPDSILISEGWNDLPQQFNPDGKYDQSGSDIRISVRDKTDRDRLLLTAQSYVKTNPLLSAKYYTLINSLYLDKSDGQKFVTNMELAGTVNKIKDYSWQATVLDSLSSIVDINSLSQKQQERFWIENYDNKLFLLGQDTLNTRNEKIQFNSDFGKIILTNEQSLHLWTKYVTGIKNSELDQSI